METWNYLSIEKNEWLRAYQNCHKRFFDLEISALNLAECQGC